MKKAGECPDTMAFCHLELQGLTIALIKLADDKERDIRLEVRAHKLTTVQTLIKTPQLTASLISAPPLLKL